ncbi:hypothetical protein LT493_10985 [Streptomyces tricolor]|nr:hypothetical protein [Streptomyces tricolor]
MHPGQSIQKAVNAAKAGDTVFVLAGTYRESVTVKTAGLTLRGAGPGTVIQPPRRRPSPRRTARRPPSPVSRTATASV